MSLLGLGQSTSRINSRTQNLDTSDTTMFKYLFLTPFFFAKLQEVHVFGLAPSRLSSRVALTGVEPKWTMQQEIVNSDPFLRVFRSQSKSPPLISYSPYFRVKSWNSATPIFQEMLNEAASTPGWEHFGWSRAGDYVRWDTTFDDVESLLASFETISPLMNQLLADAATVERLNFAAPSTILSTVQSKTARSALKELRTKPVYYETVEDIQTGYFHKPEKGLSENTCTMMPHFIIKDWKTAKPLMQEIIEAANDEPGCTYFGWEKSNNRLIARETFFDGDSMKAHVEKVRPLLDKLVAGPAELEKLEIHGPEIQVEKVKPVTDTFMPQYFQSNAMQSTEGAAP
jgi:quinol monooxygenase YgiN